ncbi:MAG: hypothetical protein AB9907_05420 [Flexilinea sp.]
MTKLRTYIFLGLLLSLPSGYGIYRLVVFSLPFLKERWLFFFLLILLICGITLPIFAALNKYFFTAKRIIPQTVIRESLVAAILCEILLWFQIGRVLTSTIIFFCVGGFMLIEILLRTRDTVSFRPGFDDIDKDDSTES